MIQINLDTSKNEFGESWWIFTEKGSRIAGRIGSQGNLSPQVKKSRKTTTSSSSGIGVCSSSGVRPVPVGKKSNSFVISDHVSGNLGFPENERRRKMSQWPCCDQIFGINVNISDFFTFRSNLPIFVSPRPASSRRGVPFWELYGFRILNFRLGRKASCSKLLGCHRSSSTFNMGHLINSNIVKKSKSVFMNKVRETKSANENDEK
jgi:hypothetical protein